MRNSICWSNEWNQLHIIIPSILGKLFISVLDTYMEFEHTFY